MPRQSDAKDRFITTAAGLFRQRGYHGVGLTEIIEAAGAPKGSFYHHFPDGKEQLAEQAIKRSAKIVLGAIEESFTDVATVREGAQNLADILAALFEKSNWQAGCPITSIALDTTPGSDRLQAATAAAFDSWAACGAAHAKRLNYQGDAEAFGRRMLIALEGAWIMARVQQSRRPFDEAVEMVMGINPASAP
ncbi:MAG: TetR/AcrR family transcriptional regulator [Alphaproteobacteria bacterium]|nr:TetR/AcrR family transcriptional regulator [Alphaproteobacteria bacterium SS10]